MNRRHLFPLPLLLALVTCSCQRVPPSIAKPLDAAHDRLAQISVGDRRASLERTLGPPARTPAAREVVWETRHDSVNFERASVTLSPSRKVTAVEWERSRGNDAGFYRWQNRQVWKSGAAKPRWLSEQSSNRSVTIPPPKREEPSHGG